MYNTVLILHTCDKYLKDFYPFFKLTEEIVYELLEERGMLQRKYLRGKVSITLVKLKFLLYRPPCIACCYLSSDISVAFGYLI